MQGRATDVNKGLNTAKIPAPLTQVLVGRTADWLLGADRQRVPMGRTAPHSLGSSPQVVVANADLLSFLVIMLLKKDC